MASSQIKGATSHHAFAHQSLSPWFRLSRQRLSVYVLFFIILTAAAIRFFRLDGQGFWYDEAVTLRLISGPAFHDIHPPAFYLLIRAWSQLGQSEFFLRLPAALMGVLSVLLIYHIGLQLVGSKAASVAAFLASISPMLVWHSQDLRMYSQAVLLVLLTVHFYLRSVRSNSWTDWIGYVAAALLAGYTHLYTVFIPFILSLHYLIFYRQRIWRWIMLHGLFAVGYLPWLLVIMNLPPDQIGTPRLSSMFNIFYTYFTFAAGYSFGPAVNDLRTYDLSVVLPYVPIIAPLAVVVVIVAVTGIRRQWQHSHENSVLVLLWAVVPVGLAVAITLLRPTMTFNTRYVLYSLPAFLWMLASGIEALGRRAGIGTLLLLTLYSGMSLSNYFFNSYYAKEDVRGAAAYIAAEAEPDDAIVVVTVTTAFRWYFNGDNLILGPIPTSLFEDELTEASQGRDTVWLVHSRHWQTDPRQEIKSFMDRQYLLSDSQQFTGVSIYRYCVNNCGIQPVTNE